jgi:hypothetical protein
VFNYIPTSLSDELPCFSLDLLAGLGIALMVGAGLVLGSLVVKADEDTALVICFA